MGVIMKYRIKDSNNEWKYYEDGDAQHCTDYLIMCDFEEDMEYEIYEFSNDGYVNGVNWESNYEPYETKLDYLFRIYDCDDIDTLNSRCPINLKLIDFDSVATNEFKQGIQEIEDIETEEIYKIIKNRCCDDSELGLTRYKKGILKKYLGAASNENIDLNKVRDHYKYENNSEDDTDR